MRAWPCELARPLLDLSDSFGPGLTQNLRICEGVILHPAKGIGIISGRNGDTGVNSRTDAAGDDQHRIPEKS
jgi:hypothetical protein